MGCLEGSRLAWPKKWSVITGKCMSYNIMIEKLRVSSLPAADNDTCRRERHDDVLTFYYMTKWTLPVYRLLWQLTSFSFHLSYLNWQHAAVLSISRYFLIDACMTGRLSACLSLSVLLASLCAHTLLLLLLPPSCTYVRYLIKYLLSWAALCAGYLEVSTYHHAPYRTFRYLGK